MDATFPTTAELAAENEEYVNGVGPFPPQTEPEGSPPPITNEDFEHRVTALMELMESDPKNRDRMLAEIYVNMASAEMGIRGVFEAIQSQGISGLMKGAFRRGK